AFFWCAGDYAESRLIGLRRSLGIAAPVRLGTLKRSSYKAKPQLSRRGLRLPASEPVIEHAELRHHTTLNAAEPAASRKRLRKRMDHATAVCRSSADTRTLRCKSCQLSAVLV